MAAIYFDLDGTLVRHAGSFEAAFDRTRKELDVPDRDGMYETYLEAFFPALNDCRPDPYASAMTEVCDRFDIPVDGETFAATYVRHELSMTEPTEGARETLAALADEHPLGVLTNGAEPVQREKLTDHGLDEYFETVVVSGTVGARKPESAIFQAARETLPAEEYVFVADDLERDVLPAQENGFTGVWFSESDDGRADRCVGSLHVVPESIR